MGFIPGVFPRSLPDAPESQAALALRSRKTVGESTASAGIGEGNPRRRVTAVGLSGRRLRKR